MKWMTTEQPQGAHPDAPRSPILLHRFQHVFRTSGMKPAGGRKKHGDEPFIEAQTDNYGFPHRVTNRSNARRNSSGVASSAARRGLITMSHSGENSCKRKRRTSRNRRFIRFLVTAFPNARGMVKPRRGPSPAPRGTSRQKAEKYTLAIRVPWLYALRKSEVLRIRKLLGNPNLVGVPDGSLVAHRELMAAFGAASRENSPPVLGTHSYPKSVRFCPFPIIWLKCAFWHLILGPGQARNVEVNFQYRRPWKTVSNQAEPSR